MDESKTDRILTLLDVVATEVVMIRGDVTSLRSDVTSLRGDVTSLRVDVTSLQGDVVSLRREMHTGFDALLRRIGRRETRVEDLETSMTDFRQEFERRVSPLEQR